MANSAFILSNYINVDDIEILKTNLYKLGILVKDYPDENLMILYNRYDNKNKVPVELECRSVIINRTTKEIECYTCPTPIYNMDAVHFLMKHPNEEKNYYECYEGTLLSLFNYNDKWFLSSRRCLNSDKSLMDNVSHYDMFMDVIKQDNYNTLDDFTKYLNRDLSYHFVLIHYNNKNVVDYTNVFGNNYKKLCFIFARNRTKQHLEISSEDLLCNFLSDNIFLPKKLENTLNFDKINQTCDMTDKPQTEGVVIKLGKHILKLQTIQYQFYKSIGSDNNLFVGFLKLYQSNKLMDYFKNNKNSEKYSKIVNPKNTSESFDTVGTIDAIFKVCTSELHNLFKLLWGDNGEHNNSKLYELLPKEYKDIMYNLRGIFFKNRLKYVNSDEYLTVKNIYNYIKSMEIDSLVGFLRMRKLMLNWIRIDKEKKLEDFSKCLYTGNYTNMKVLYKLTAIYCSKLFPEIMATDIPQ
jgi:hypothetical protein